MPTRVADRRSRPSGESERPAVPVVLALVVAFGFAAPPVFAQADDEPRSPIQLSQADDAAEDDDLFGEDDDLFGDDDDLFGDDVDVAPAPTPTPTQPTTGDTSDDGGSTAPTPSAPGAPLPPGQGGIEELLITGSVRQRREASVTDSGMQFNADALKDLGAADVADLADVTPNLEIKTAGVGAPTFFIRGIGLSDFSGNAASAVTIVQDGTVMDAPAVQLGLLYDIGNVEVLNGPQPGGHYRNSSAGALVVSSKAPDGDVAATIRLSGGNFSAQDFEGFLNLPLIDDLLYTRFSFRYQDRDGFYDNVCANAGPLESRSPGAPTNRFTPGLLKGTCGEDDPANVPDGLKSEPFNTHVWAGRAQVRLLPDLEQFENLDFILGVNGEFRDQGNQIPATVPAGASPAVRDLNFPPGSVFARRTGFLGTGNYIPLEINNAYFRLADRVGATQCPPGTTQRQACINDIVVPLLSENLAKRGDSDPYSVANNRDATIRQNTWTGFLKSNVDVGDISVGDVDLGTLKFSNVTSFNEYWRNRVSDNDGTPNTQFESVTKDKAWQFWSHAKFEGEMNPEALPGPVRWELGAYYLQGELKVEVDDFVAGSEGPRFRREYTQDTVAAAGYASLEFNLGDFVLGGAFRYNFERKVFDATRVLFQDPTDLVVESRDVDTYTSPTGQLSLVWNLRDDINFFWKYSRSHKAGHFNSTADPIRGITNADPENIDAYEIGFKSKFFDGRVELDANFFFYEYKNFQLFIVEQSFGTNPQLEVQNAEQVENYGAEVRLKLEPIERFTIDLNFGWLESQFIRFTDEVLRQIPVGENFSEFETFLVVSDFSGNRLPNSPQFSLSGTFQYELDMGNYGFLIPRYDFNWVDDTFFDREEGRGSPNVFGQRNLSDFSIAQKDRILHNIRLSYVTPDRKIEIAGWGRNITNEVFRITGFDATVVNAGVIHFLGEPRMFGGEVVYNW